MAWALGWPLAADAQIQGQTVWLVLSEPGGVHEEAALHLSRALGQGQAGPKALHRLAPAALPAVPESPPALVVTFGVSALRAVRDRARADSAWSRLPVLAALLPRAGFEAVVPSPVPNVSAAFLDQPLGRYLDLLRLAMPDRIRVGALLGATSSRLADDLSRAAELRGLKAETERVNEPARSEDIYSALRAVLSRSDVLLALPDSQVFNAASLQNILIATYRQRVPMLSYSAAHVRAGATLALYTSPAQAAQQAAGMAMQMLAGRDLPPPRVADDFSVAVNEAVSRSLGLALAGGTGGDSLAALLRQQGRTP